MEDLNRFNKFDITANAEELFYRVCDEIAESLDAELDADHPEGVPGIIYDALINRIGIVPFGDYLKRRINEDYAKKFSVGQQDAGRERELDWYRNYIKNRFSANRTGAAFEPTTAKVYAVAKNWLTRPTVSRKTVFLLGFGLNMELEAVEKLLREALYERGINFKDSFEVICRYCFKNRLGIGKFRELWNAYLNAAPKAEADPPHLSALTGVVKSFAEALDDEAAMLDFVSGLKAANGASKFSVTMREQFDRLYARAREIIAEESGGRVAPEDVTPVDLENRISEAIPKNADGNLVSRSEEACALCAVCDGRRFNRQHVSAILKDKAEVTRFDLVLLNFYIFAKREYAKANQRYYDFLRDTNDMLNACGLAELSSKNPHDCFVQFCINTEDPLLTYSCVWDLAYDDEDE